MARTDAVRRLGQPILAFDDERRRNRRDFRERARNDASEADDQRAALAATQSLAARARNTATTCPAARNSSVGKPRPLYSLAIV